jgi:hypothetical protein
MLDSAVGQDRSICDGPDDLRGLCRIGGIAAFVAIAYSLATMAQMVVLGGPPKTVAEAFSLLERNKVVGLLRLDLPTVIVLPLYYLLFLGLYAALRRVNRANALLSTALVFSGLTMLLSTPGPLSMLALSHRYAAATSDGLRAQLLAAGEAVMAGDIWHGTGAILGGALVQCGAVLICVVMLRGGVFSRTAAWLGIAMHALDLAHIVGGLFVPGIGVVLMATAGPLYPFWFFLVGRRLMQLATPPPKT